MAKAEFRRVPLERSPSHLLHRALQHALDIYVAHAGETGPTQRQFAVLAAVAANEGLTQTDLVRATGIDRSTLADLVARMIGKGLLARERSATDGRANTVRLSDAGRAALRSTAPQVAAADKKILSLVPRDAREGFLAVLLAMSEAAEHQQGEGAARVEAPRVKPAKTKTAPELTPAPAPKKKKKAKAEDDARSVKKKKKPKKG